MAVRPGFFRQHVGGRTADHVVAHARVVWQLGDQTEIEEDWAPCGVTPALDGLMSRWSFPPMKRCNALDELQKRWRSRSSNRLSALCNGVSRDGPSSVIGPTGIYCRSVDVQRLVKPLEQPEGETVLLVLERLQDLFAE